MGVQHGFAKAHSHGEHFRIASAGDVRAPARVEAEGELDRGRCRQLEDAFYAALDRRPAAILVDVGAVTVIESDGLYALLRMVDQCHGVELEFRLSTPVERLLDVAGDKHHLPGAAASAVQRRRRRQRRFKHRLRRERRTG
jgi:anti-anti-sigma factor